MKNGQVGKYVTEAHLSKADIAISLKSMKDSSGWKILELALADFKAHTEKKLNAIPLGVAGYDRIIAVTLREHEFKNWIDAFVGEMISFEEATQDTSSDFNYL